MTCVVRLDDADWSDVGLNEAQLINPQGTNKNMAARNLVNIWVAYGGRVVYNKGEDVIVIRKDDEFLIRYKEVIIHIIPKKQIEVRVNGHWLVSRAPTWRGKAVVIARRLRSEFPIPIPVP